jgi:cullin 2
VKVLLEEVQQHIKQAGLEAIADLKGENIHIDFVENMLAVHKKYRDLIQAKKKNLLNSFKSRSR